MRNNHETYFRSCLAQGLSLSYNTAYSLCALFIAVSLTLSCWPQPPSKLSLSAVPKTEVEVRLEYISFTSPAAQWMALQSSGQLRAYHFNPYLLQVTSIVAGTIANSEVTTLLQSLQERAVQEAFQKKDFSGSGLTRGDRASLSVTAADGTTSACLGFVEDMPQPLQTFIQALRKNTERLPAAPLAEAYVRSQPIPSQRMAALRREGKLRVWEITDLPTALAPIVTNALAYPGMFYPLSKPQHEQLLSLNTGQAELFVSQATTGGKLTLFTRRP